MCTAINYKVKDHYFGRNLDLEYHYDERVVITPRNYPFRFRHLPISNHHPAMIGMATVVDDYPLYYEGTNEHGLSIAALNFPGNAIYNQVVADKLNVAPFELIPWLLCNCRNLEESICLIDTVNICDTAFNNIYPNTPLHWIIAYKDKSIVVEQTKEGLYIYDNPVGVLTNNPPFPYHLQNLQNYMHLSPKNPVNHFSRRLDLEPYSRGMGALGLPGDLSSASRFIRAAFVKENAESTEQEVDAVSQFFHMLNVVSMPRGALIINEKCEITIYSSCCNTDRGIYYYTTYDNSGVVGICMFHEDLNESGLCIYPLRSGEIHFEN